VEDSAIRQSLYLISKGWEPNIVFSMEEKKRIAFFIIHQEQDGAGKFNFQTMRFSDSKK